MGRARDGADDDVVELQPQLGFLRTHLLGEADEAQAAKLMNRGPRRNGVGFSALGLDVLQGALPALADTDVEPFVDQLDLGPHDAGHQDVADTVINGVLERDPALLNQTALHPDLGRHGRHLTRVIGLHATDGNQRIGIRGQSIGHDVLQLAELVAPKSQA